jgi:hypothetical protein
MNRAVDSADVNAWILKLKDDKIRIAFPEFVEQYSALFAGSDPGTSLHFTLFLSLLVIVHL